MSSIFTIPKKSGERRPVINLKNLNTFVKYDHFKMETFKNVQDLMMQSDFMTSIDLRDAYFSIPIHEDHHRFLGFSWEKAYYCFQCLPFGLSSAPRVFTKVLKPVMAAIRCRGIRSMIYLDDIIIFANSRQASLEHTSFVCNLLSSLGFEINFEKSCLSPKTDTTYLGFCIDSASMSISLPGEKVEKLKSVGSSILASNRVIVRDLAKFIGIIVSSFEAFPKGRIHYRKLESFKTKALESSGGNFDSFVSLNTDALCEIQWWLSIPSDAFTTPAKMPPISITLRTDASSTGWGAFCENDYSFSQGVWSSKYADLHINVLELLAIQHALSSLCNSRMNAHIHIKSDNSSAVSYIKKFGGRISMLDGISRAIWSWCFERNIWLSASHLAGIANIEADTLSRRDLNKELHLCPDRFFSICQHFNVCLDVDLFSSRFNNQLPCYVTWKYDPCAFAVDAFTISWNALNIYLFPPFCLLTRVLQKLREDKVDMALLIAPLWRAQPWYPMILQLLVAPPLLLPPNSLVGHSNPFPNLKLTAWIISTKVGAQRAFRNTLPASSPSLGEMEPTNNMNRLGNSGFAGVIHNRLIPLTRVL